MKYLSGVLAFAVTFFIGVLAVTTPAQDDSELVRIANNFSESFKNVDEQTMERLIADDFRYYTDLPCSYKDCDQGAGKDDYIQGIVDERRDRRFSILSVDMKYIKPDVDEQSSASERKISFKCKLVSTANGRTYKYHSVVNYYFRKINDEWKISKIENRR
jgi:hypothetical protein